MHCTGRIHHTTRPKVALYILYLLLRYGRDFLTELFLKNVDFGARVGPPLGAGEEVLWKPRGESLQYF